MKYALLLLGLLLTTSSMAGVGVVTELSGTAIIKRAKETISVNKSTEVEMNDRVETKNGKVKITFKDNTVVTVTESSGLVIDDFVYDPKSGGGKLALKAAAGTVRYASGNIAHNNPNAVKINTPTASIAVRGTDFVMAVGETGSSMVMLMPTCETEQSVNLKGLTCGSGKIDVETPAGIVKMDKPYQATLVETAGSMPSAPVFVLLNGMGINNNLLISPPQTASGMNIMQVARAAAEKTGDAKKSDSNDDAKDDEKQQVATSSDKNIAKSSSDSGTTRLVVDDNVDELLSNKVASRGETEDPYVFKLYKDKSQTQQIGWEYESLSPNGKNYANIVMPTSTQVQVVVSQDMQINSYNFSSGKPQGSITVVQNYR
jgi:hypothetical protein